MRLSRRMSAFVRLAFASAAIQVSMGMACPQGPDLLANMQYTPLTPPTSLMLPGAVLAIEEEIVNGEKQEIYYSVCGPRSSLGQDAQVQQSSTISSSFADNKKSSWTFDAAHMKSLGANIDASSFKSITASIQNARVLSLSDADVLANLPFRSTECKAAIRQRLAQNYKLTMISSSLVADMLYVVEWDETKAAKLSAKERIIEMQKLSANLGGGVSRVGQKKIESKQLALGIRTDAFLLALSVPDMEPWTEQVVQQATDEKSGPIKPMRADTSSPDSKYTLPAGGTYQPVEYDFSDN